MTNTTTATFDFSDVDVNAVNSNSEGRTQYIKLTTDKTNVRTVSVTACEYGVSSLKKTPYAKITVTDTDGNTADKTYYISTTVNEGKKCSSFDTSKTDMIKFLVVTGMTETKAKEYLTTAKSYEDLVTKLSVIVGPKFKMGFYGKITPNSSGKTFLKTMFAEGANNILPLTTADDKVNTNDKKDETTQFYTTDQTVATTTTGTDELPF